MPVVKWHSWEDNPHLTERWLCHEIALTFPGDGEDLGDEDELLLKLNKVLLKQFAKMGH